MKHLYLILFLFCFALLSAQTVDHIWYETDIFPYIISSGPQKGTGAADLAVDLIDSYISDHPHEKIIMPSKRIQEEIKAGASALWPTAISSPEREEYFIFSRPYIIIKPLKFVSFANRDIPLEIDDQFFTLNQDFQIAVVRGRSYGSLINEMLKTVPSENLLAVDSLKDGFSRLHRLLNMRRLTGFFAYEDEVNALCEEQGIPIESFRFSNVAGLQYIIGSVAAPKNPWGSAIINRINRVVDKIKKPVALKYMEFLPPDSRDEYLKDSREILEY